MKRRPFLKKAGGVVGGAGIFVGASHLWGRNSTQPSQETTEEGTYYVSPDGNDGNSGTWDQPFRTLETAVEDVEAGETIYLRGGTYHHDDQITIADIAGTAEDEITIAGYEDERPVFEFDGPIPGGWDADGGIHFENVSHLSVRDFSVRNSPHMGIYVQSQSENNRFANLSISNNNLAGIGFYEDSSNNLIQNLLSANNYDRQNGGEDADGIQFSQTEKNRVVNGNFFYNSDDGIDLWDSNSIEVERCLSWNNGRGENGGGNGFKLGGGEDSGDHRIVRNVAFHNRGIGFSYNEATSPITLYNNTAWRNSHNYSFYEDEHRLVNNIGYHGRVALGVSVEDDHNTWNLDIEDPGFASYHPDDDRFLHLADGSPCIDAGTDVGLDYQGEAPDLGAYRYDGSR